MKKRITEWTDDCQGKKNYDGPLIRVSSRYWPRGGGFHLLVGRNFVESGKIRPDIKPSAESSIMLADETTIFEKKFEAETEEEVKAQVETWVEEKYEIIRQAIDAAIRAERKAK